MSVTVVTARIRVVYPTQTLDDEKGQEAYDAFWATTTKIEDLVNFVLPAGYYCKVEE